jgi:hypothetical protein
MITREYPVPHDAYALPLDVHADREETRQTEPVRPGRGRPDDRHGPDTRVPPPVLGVLAATVTTNFAALQTNKLRCRRLTGRWL